MDQADPKFCFALMPPVQSSNTVYKHIIKKATEENALNSENILHVFDIHNVTDAILERIYKARVIIADLSGRDPDVFYLTGICHGLDKDVILLACEPNDIPFDLRELGHVIYSTESFAEGIKAGNKLKLILKQILNKAPTNSRNKDIQTHTPTIVNSKNEVDDKQKNQEHNVNRTDLRQKLGTHFNVGELRTLCFDLGVDYENIPSLTKEEMVREMVLYCERHGRFNDLIVLCHGLRPHVNW